MGGRLDSQQCHLPTSLVNASLYTLAIENMLLYVRDVTFEEDDNGIRIGNTPRILASFTKAPITALRLAAKNQHR